MADIAKLLKTEISRLARKEVRAAMETVNAQLRDLKKTVRTQKSEIASLQAALRKKVDRQSAAAKRAEAVKSDSGSKVRVSPRSIRQHRQRLRLSQRQLGLLLGVTTLSISNWERGQVRPRGKNLEAFAQLRYVGLREAKARLSELEEPRKKPGRKKATPESKAKPASKGKAKAASKGKAKAASKGKAKAAPKAKAKAAPKAKAKAAPKAKAKRGKKSTNSKKKATKAKK